MAFGDLIKSATVSANASSHTPDFGSNPTAGNLLIFAVAGGNSAVDVSSTPTGFILLHLSNAGGGTWAWYYKISVGNEQTATINWTGTTNGRQNYHEYEWDGSTPTVTPEENTDNINSTVNSQASGAVTPGGSTNICIAVHGTDGNRNSFSGQDIDGSWIKDKIYSDDGTGTAEMKISRLVNATGSQEATHSDTDTGDQMYGAIAVFDIAAVSGATPKGPFGLPLHGPFAGPIGP